MYLKSLELHGFKSFPDKVTLEFGKGLTAVVGPNGSGKSNIGDAVRWVLGEQSTKMLRGGKMEDVIFGGTELRKPVSFASVTLNIVNDDRTLNVDADFVSVTRRLWRNGLSEYIINGNQVRLKDILELFMDTGLGRDGYSIIGQGRVADIVGSKSNERREIFEEAAGISKFRYKKAESERKLKTAEENILRLKDILSELEGRVEPLRIQSEKAKKYLVLAESRKALEIAVWTRKLSELKSQISDLEDKLLVSQGEYDLLTNEIDSSETEIAELNLKRAQCSQAVEEYRARISELESQNAEKAADIAVLRNNIKHYNDSIDELKKKQTELSLAGEQLQEKINEKKLLADEISLKRDDLQKEIDLLEDKLLKLSNQAEEYDKTLSGSSDKLNKLYIQKSSLSFAIANAKATKTDCENAIAEADSAKEDIIKLIEEAQSEYNDVKNGISDINNQISEHTNKLNGYSMLYNKKAEHLKNATAEYNNADLDIRNLTQRRDMLVDLENSMEGFAYSVKQIIKAGKSGQLRGVKGTVAQIISTDSKYSLAIETALGGAMQNIVVDNEDTAKKGIRILKETNGGRATFLPITSVKGNELNVDGIDMMEGFVATAHELVKYDDEYHGIVLSLLGRIVIAEDIDLATNIAKKCGYKFRIITLDGQVINAGGSFTGGSSSKTTGVLSRKNEIAAVEKKIEALSKTHKLLADRVKDLTAEVEKLGYDVEGEREMISIMDTDKVRFEGELARLKLVIDQHRERLDEADNAIKQNRDKIAQSENTVIQSEASLEACESEIASLEELVSSAQKMGTESRTVRESLSKEISDKKLLSVELSKDIEAALLSVTQLEGNALQSQSDMALQNQKIEEFLRAIKDEEENIIEREQDAENAKSLIARLNENIKTELANAMDHERMANTLRQSQRSKQDEKERVSADVSRLSERHENLSRDNDQIINQLWESYSLTVAEAIDQAEEIEDMQDATKRLNELKNKIRALGSVNTDAIDEYKEVSERYEFLSAQLTDVLKSKSELESLISSLTQSMKEIFSESFKKINENFKKTFVELFGGGKAELALTDPNNVLESGIEINVAPPGKVIKNLSLLSGGEQAFVAIAIYFAILKLRPSPFCILDEIEAALDDVNVTRYAQYLRNFTDTTQFILVTHRRGTMEEADILYGVTMQEKGVSKLLRMDISDAALAAEN